ncbi:bile acid:sodium symporter family protein [Thiomicrorhabdus cannonii]|uniref:bile acid:sodium symporter family protein n=1 Tax=Thiomicrorhabdus cannonii TaxID=2748011 RepID=UPI0015BE086C|nr:bile acid:sodium symporter family protein [Thiomicrorhabdus cannonii]
MSSDILTTLILPAALFLIMFGMGLSLRPDDFKRVALAPKAVGIGLIGQMLLLPLVAFGIAVALSLPAEIAVGLMIIALAPGGATSNMFTYLSKGDVSLSITLTAVVSLITPFTIPLLAAWSMTYFMGSGTEFSLPLVKTIVQLLVITVIPVALGMFVLSRWPQVAAKLEAFFKWFSVAFLLLVIILIVLKNAANMASFFAQAGLATLLLNVSVLILGYQLAKRARLSQPQAVSVGFEVGIQNGTLALVVAGTLIGNAAMMIPAVTYSLLMFASGAAFAWWVQRRTV